MKYREIGDLRLSEYGLGTWALGGPYWTDGEPTGWSGSIEPADITNAVNLALEAGVNHFDCADVYGHGRAERLLGQALGKKRQSAVIATKVGFTPTSAPHVYDRENIQFQCEQSLRNLDTDYIDIYYFHHCDFGPDDAYLEGAVEAFDRLRARGMIRHVGLSGYAPTDLLRLAPIVKPQVIQGWADIEHDEFIRPTLPLYSYMRRNGIGFIPMMPFGQGRLLGKYKAAQPPVFGEGDNREGSSALTAASLENLEPRLNKLRERFGPTTKDLARVALQFLLSNNVVASVIPGFRDKQQVADILAGVDRPLSDEDIAFVLSAFPRDEMPPHPWEE